MGHVVFLKVLSEGQGGRQQDLPYDVEAQVSEQHLATKPCNITPKMRRKALVLRLVSAQNDKQQLGHREETGDCVAFPEGKKNAKERE